MSGIKLVVDERGSGRTTQLIHWASEKHSTASRRYIVCHSQQESGRVFREAMAIGMPINYPMTWDEATRVRGHHSPIELAIDNLSLILPNLLPAEIVTVVL